MDVCGKKADIIGKMISEGKTVYCQGLFLSARWFVLAQAAGNGVNLVVLPDRESAEYCASDLYGLTEGDSVFFLPDSGRNMEKSNYKSSLGVQRTSAVEKILGNDSSLSPVFVVTYPSALEEGIPLTDKIKDSVLTRLETR